MVLKWPGRWGTGEGQRLIHSPWGTLGQKHFTLSKTHGHACSRGTGWGLRVVGGGRQDRGSGADASTAQHTAGQTMYRRAGPAAPRRAPRARCPSLASAFRIFLFQRQRLHDLEGSLGPGASAAGPPAPCCPRYFLPVLTAQVFRSFSHCSSRPSEGGPAPHCPERRLRTRGLSDSLKVRGLGLWGGLWGSPALTSLW